MEECALDRSWVRPSEKLVRHWRLRRKARVQATGLVLAVL